MQILRAKPDDAPKLTEIAVTAKCHWGYPDEWMARWVHLLTIEPRLIAEQETYAACVDGVLVGFYSLSHGLGKMSLDHLWVLPGAMRRGVGRALFAHAAARVKAAGCETLEIVSEPNAAGFYERLGARRVATIMSEIEGQPRELPVLVYAMTGAATRADT